MTALLIFDVGGGPLVGGHPVWSTVCAQAPRHSAADQKGRQRRDEGATSLPHLPADSLAASLTCGDARTEKPFKLLPA